MGNPLESKSFFDHSLQTALPESKKNNIEKTHDQFSTFRDELKLMFLGIPDSAVNLLFNKYSSSSTYLQDSINAYLDDSSKFLNNSATSDNRASIEMNYVDKLREGMSENSYCSVRYEYKSRKRGIESILKNDSSKYFKKTGNGKGLTANIKIQAKNPNNSPKSAETKEPELIEQYSGKVHWKKYIGTVNISCWCTRTLYGLSSIYTDNRIVFDKPVGADVVYVYHQPNNSTQRRELGRVNESTAEIVASLIDEKAVQFESRLFFVEGSKLGAGDTFIIRTDCFISGRIFSEGDVEENSNDFDLNQLKVVKNSEGKIQAGTKLKNAMVKLFVLLDLKSTKDIEKGRTQVKIEKDKNNFNEYHMVMENDEMEDDVKRETDSDFSTSYEHEDLKLSMNQVKDLYRNTEHHNLQQSLPESVPNNFKIELRPYQKLGLSWLLQREKEYDIIGLNNMNLDSDLKDMVIQQLKLAENSANPLWKEYPWPDLPVRLQHMDLPQNCRDTFYLNLYKGSCSMTRPMIKSTCKGGILADEMGLGKTITTFSLVLSCPKDLRYEQLPVDHVERITDYAYSTTLIVVPMALLTQWEKEFLKVVDNPKSIRCFVYYGSESSKDLKKLLLSPHPPVVVLTTYGMVQSDWTKLERSEQCSGLFSVKFLRVILDEGHNIRNKTTKTAKAVYDLKADRKWVLTGTPIINRLEDIFSLLHFLGLKPWSYHSLWKQCISIPFESGKDVDVATDLLKSILDPILLRRTKNQKDADGNLLITLPSKEVVIEKVSFNKREQVIYQWLKERAVNSFNENLKSGMVFKNYSSILTQLLRLRQVCCHVDLIKSKTPENLSDTNSLQVKSEDSLLKDESTEKDDEILAMVRNIESFEKKQRIPPAEIQQLKEKIYEKYPSFSEQECAICTEPIDVNTCVITECMHCFCFSCLIEHFEFQMKHKSYANIEESSDSSLNSKNISKIEADEVLCPLCREKVNRNRMLRTAGKKVSAVNTSTFDSSEALMTQIQDDTRSYYVRPFLPNLQSSKINALLIHLERIRFESPGDHIVVFSQFTSFLDIIETELTKYKNEFEVHKFDGRLNLDQRQKVLEEFEKDIPLVEKKVSILLLSLKAGGVGLNLTVASNAFLMDPHWNNAIEFQAIDRIHRVGQTKNVHVVRFIVNESIEERMLQIQARKNQLGDAMTLTDDERKKRNLEELQSIFAE